MTRLKILLVTFDSSESPFGTRPQTDQIRDVGAKSTHKLVTVLAATAASPFNYDSRRYIPQLTALMGGGRCPASTGVKTFMSLSHFLH